MKKEKGKRKKLFRVYRWGLVEGFDIPSVTLSEAVARVEEPIKKTATPRVAS